MTARNLHIISVSQIKFLTTETVDPIFPALKVYFKHKFDSSKTHNANETVKTAVQDRHSETVTCQGEMGYNKPTLGE